jgi:hypothetical protein
VNGREVLLTDAVEQIAPGTAEKLLSPLWDALDYAAPKAAWRLRRTRAALPPEVIGQVFGVGGSRHDWIWDFLVDIFDLWEMHHRLDETMASFAAVALVVRDMAQVMKCPMPQERTTKLHWDWIGAFGALRCLAARYAAAEHLPEEDGAALIWAADELFPAPSAIHQAEYERWVDDVKARRRVGILFGFVEAARSP